MTVLGLCLAVVALEASRFGWHARESRWPLLVLHAALAAVLAATQASWLAPVAVGSVLASRRALDLKRRNHPLGVALSGLSALPWEACALAWMGWPDGIAMEWPRPSTLAILPTAYLAGAPWAYWRPAHWSQSRWAWLYPDWWMRP